LALRKQEVDMRLLLIPACLLSLSGFGSVGPVKSGAIAAECTGENCPPPAGGGQGRGGHCDHEKQEQTTS
jgi:hypothetical protein